MAQPLSLLNSRGQSLDVIVDSGGTIRLKLSVGSKSTGLTDDAAWQGVATHADGDTFVAADGVVVGGGIDAVAAVHPILVDTSGRPFVVLQPSTGSMTDRSGSVAVGATAQTLAPVLLTRKYLLVENLSTTEDLWINFTTAAVIDQPSIKLLPGAAFVMEGSYVSSQLVSVIATTAGHKYTAKEA